MLMRERVLDRMRRDVLSCAFRPGEDLREADLAERYDVSKAPVRDALQRLTFEGLIETMPRRGHRVAPVSVADAKDLLEMREALEVAACRLIVARLSDAELTALDRLRLADTEDAEAFALYNREFHIAIAEASGNRRLAAEMRRLLDGYHRLCLVSLSEARATDGDMTAPLAEHGALIDALQARNGRRAARIVRRHVSRSRIQILRGLDQRVVVE